MTSSNKITDASNTKTLLESCESATRYLADLENEARGQLAVCTMQNGKVSSTKLNEKQFAAHGCAWLATYCEALRQLLAWAKALHDRSLLTDLEHLILAAGFGEYLAQIRGGIAMSQVEIVRLSHLGIHPSSEKFFDTSEIIKLIEYGTNDETRSAIAELICEDYFGDPGIEDSSLSMIKDQFRRFSDEQIAPGAQTWHREDLLIPDTIIAQMSDLGVFGLTIPERWGGIQLGKIAMCMVTEELCRGYLGVGSLATRTEIAADLILLHGTNSQKELWLEGLAKGTILPTALFTEPGTGSDLASVATQARLSRNSYLVTGAKTWSTHASRADLMTMLVRTDSSKTGYEGVSMLMAPKPRGNSRSLFPAQGMSGTEIKVLGYRGMKEFEIAFSDFSVPKDCLLGGLEGQGFKQLMGSMETARIQTAARALGVAQCALELGLNYAKDRIQFGKSIFTFPRIHGKLASMAVEIMIARQLTWSAARKKDSGERCDLEAGMAKLLASRVAWASADNSVQIHGGNGYAEEYPISRVLVDSRILNVFEGTGEIQAQIIARRLLERDQPLPH
ncbi:MAG: acyl-CoA dehydrogenase family protein [Pseudomonadota bacterium]|nr:acyl-CoA dehydrogenase family protein [Pseudomonadota bacterium]